MIGSRGGALLLWLALLVLAVTLAIYIVFVKGSADYSIESLRAERGTLVKQDIQFLSRGRDYAHYAVTAISDKRDTVRAQYRLPAAESKTKSLLWVYDEPRDLNMSEALDNVRQAQSAAVLALNVHDLFERDASGKVKESRGNAWRGMAASKRRIDVLLQFLQKHHMNDTTQIYLGGADFAAPAVLAAAAGLPHRLGGIGFVDISSASSEVSGWSEIDFVMPKTWANQIYSKRVAQIEGKTASKSLESSGFSQSVEKIAYDDAYGPISELGSMVRWVVGADTVSALERVTPDTSLIRTKTVTLR